MRKIKAFSLIELMVSMIIIAMLLSAFVPVITKRLSSKTVFVGSSSNSGSNSGSEAEPNVEYETVTTSSDFLIPQGAIDFKILSLKSGGGGGGGAYIKQTSQLLDGTNGTTVQKPQSQADCPKDRNGNDYTVYVANQCITKYNIGDTVSSGNSDFALPSTVKISPTTGLYYENGTTYSIKELKYSYSYSMYDWNQDTADNYEMMGWECEGTQCYDSYELLSMNGCVPSTNLSYIETNSLCVNKCGITDYGNAYTACNTQPYSYTYQAARALCSNFAPYGTSKGNWTLIKSDLTNSQVSSVLSGLNFNNSNLARLYAFSCSSGSCEFLHGDSTIIEPDYSNSFYGTYSYYFLTCDLNNGYGSDEVTRNYECIDNYYGENDCYSCGYSEFDANKLDIGNIAILTGLYSGYYIRNSALYHNTFPTYSKDRWGNTGGNHYYMGQARCTLQYKIGQIYIPYTGGYGAPSGNLSDLSFQVPQECKESDGACTFSIQKGNGGAGGTSQIGSSTNGSVGGETVVKIFDTAHSSTIYWGIKIYNSAGGTRGTDGSNGSNGSVDTQLCALYDTTTSSWGSAQNCSYFASENSATYSQATIDTTSGVGKGGYFNTSTNTPVNGTAGHTGDVQVEYKKPKN